MFQHRFSTQLTTNRWHLGVGPYQHAECSSVSARFCMYGVCSIQFSWEPKRLSRLHKSFRPWLLVLTDSNSCSLSAGNTAAAPDLFQRRARSARRKRSSRSLCLRTTSRSILMSASIQLGHAKTRNSCANRLTIWHLRIVALLRHFSQARLQHNPRSKRVAHRHTPRRLPQAYPDTSSA